MHVSAIVLVALLTAVNARRISHNAKCGSNGKGQTCLGSQWGDCCSQNGWCGESNAYCGSGCQKRFGACDDDTPTPSPLPSLTPSTPKSKNARCGAGFGGSTCLGSQWGDCCSQWSYCGSTSDYCRPSKGCQDKYGHCDSVPISSSMVLKSSSQSLEKPLNTKSSSTEVVSTKISSSKVQSTKISSTKASSTKTSSLSKSSTTSSKASSSSQSQPSSSKILSSSPVQPTPTRACSSNDAVLQVLAGPLSATASDLCLSYIGGDKIIQRTSTEIVSGPVRTVAVTAPDYTQIATVDVTTLDIITKSSFVQLPNPTSTLYVTVAAQPVRRDELPAQLQPFAASRISSACSCIATPVTRTILATQFSSVPGADNTQTVPGATVTSLVFRTVVVTSETNVVQTLSPTALDIQTIQTTLSSSPTPTPITVGPQCAVPGGNAKIASFLSVMRYSNELDCISFCKAVGPQCLSIQLQKGFDLQPNGSLVRIYLCRVFDKPVSEVVSTTGSGFFYYDQAC